MVLRARLAGLVSAVFLVASVVAADRAAAQGPTDLSGTWVLDRELSQLPREIGFGTITPPAGSGDGAPGGQAGRRGSRGGGAGGGGLQPTLRPTGESYDEGRRRQLLSDEVRTPPARLTIVDTPTEVKVTDDKGHTRTFHPGGPAEPLPLENVTVLTIASRDDGKLTVLFSVADLRQIRYTFSRSLGGGPLIVDAQFLERGAGDSVRRVYKPEAAPARSTAAGAPASGSPASGTPAAAAADRNAGGVPAAGSGGPAVLPRAGSEFRGLTRIGLVVEELGSPAATCGLKRDAIQAAVAKYFTDAGLKVTRDSDDDTYVYVRIMTSMLGTTCVSRYDWTIYSMADTTLSHQRSPLLLQVELARRGGLVGGAPAGHAADVLQQMGSGLAQVAATIRDASK